MNLPNNTSKFIMDQFLESQQLSQQLQKIIVDQATGKEITSKIYYNGTVIMGECVNNLYQGKCIIVVSSTAVINGDFIDSKPIRGDLTLENLIYSGELTPDGEFV